MTVYQPLGIRRAVPHLAGLAACLFLVASASAQVIPAANPVSDEFNSTSLNKSLWTFENAAGDASYSLNGSHLLLTAPAGVNHDPSFGGMDYGVRVVQRLGDGDFAVEAKFDSFPSKQYQFEGIMIGQDPANFLRFQIGSNGSSIAVNASKTLGGVETFAVGGPVSLPAGAASIWLRVQRSGNTWTEKWSTDGVAWNGGGSFDQPMVPVDLGPFSGNYSQPAGAAQAFTASVDYLRAIPPLAPDNFNGAALDTTLWSFINPAGDGSYSLNGSELVLNVPGGSNHDPAFGGVNNSVRIVQAVANGDFIVEAKFDSIPSQPYQFEGIVVEQDAGNYLRFQVGSNGSSVDVTASKILSAVQTAVPEISTAVPAGTTNLWLRISKSGNVWTEAWSTDGLTYNTAGFFWQSLAISDIGLFAGNYSDPAKSSPAFSARIDSFSTIQVTTPLLHFSAIADTGETVSFTLDTSVPNSYDPIQYPNLPAQGVYRNAIHNLTFEGTTIPLTDMTTETAVTGDPAFFESVLTVGPLLNTESLSLELFFAGTSTVSPLQTDPSVYQSAFRSPSNLFRQEPPARTNTNLLSNLTVTIQR